MTADGSRPAARLGICSVALIAVYTVAGCATVHTTPPAATSAPRPAPSLGTTPSSPDSGVVGSPTPPTSPDPTEGNPGALSHSPTPMGTGCQSGTVTITHRPVEPEHSATCVHLGATLQLTLTVEGEGGWTPLAVDPAGTATVTSSTSADGTVHAAVRANNAGNFTLATETTSTTAPASAWKLSVTVEP